MSILVSVSSVWVGFAASEVVGGRCGGGGCAGGIMNSVFKFVKDNGVATDYSYPYEERVRKFKV